MADIELEGDADDLECGLETVFSKIEEKKLVKPQQSKIHQSSSKVTSRAEQPEKPQTGILSNSGNKSELSVTPANKLLPRKQADSTRKNVSKGTSDVGDIADLIGSLDSDRKKAGEVVSKTKTKTDDSKAEASKLVVPSVAASRKRKASASDNTDPAKAKKVNDVVKDKCSEPMDDTDDVIIIKEEKVDGKDGKIVPKDDKDDVIIIREEKVGSKDGKIVSMDDKDIIAKNDEKTVQKIPPCSEEDSRIIDNELVEEMMEKVKKGALPFGDRYIVRFSPVEIGDLADESLQKLVSSTANLVFYFRRQGKFKKKKGYAEVYLFQAQDAVSFIEKLLQLKLLEHRIEVTITMPKQNKDHDVFSFVICLDKNSKLVKLKSAEDGSKVPAETPKEHLQIEKVPASADTQTLRMLFPFALDVAFSPEQKKVESEFKGPVNVSYISAGLLEAVLDCCCEHTFNGQSLSIKYTRKKQEPKVKPDSEVKRESTADKERRNSVHDNNGDSGSKTDKDGTSSSAKTKSENATASAKSDNQDEDISNMTRDVCSGMMESLNKLRQLGTANPNVMRILEMQNELLKLQKTLTTDQLPAAVEEDPWTVTEADTLDDKQNKQNESEKEQEKKLPKEQKKKPEKESRTEKQKREMEDLQRMIDEAEVVKREREERAKKNLEIEMQKMKEVEDKRKSGWARRMIEDAKQTHVSGENTTSKEDVQRILKLVENKRKEAEEARNVEETKGSETIKSEQAAGNAGRPGEILKAMGLDSQEIPDHNQFGAVAHEGVPLTDKSTASGKTEDIKSDVVAWSPSRALHEEAPVYSEEEFTQVCSSHAGGVLPWDHHVRITYYTDRRCPVESCPATKYFKTAESFLGHWELFHTPQVTVKFCQKCNAYFTNVSELESHLLNRHSINNTQTVKQMSLEAREKIVANPSFRDPGKYLPPLVTFM